MTFPRDPISAVTHRDPYPYYATLIAERPLYYDEALGLWIASSAEAVTAILTDDLCRVRPTAEPIPEALLGSPAANIFRHLVRMNEGEGHCRLKQAVSATLTSVDATQIAEHSRDWAQRLLTESSLSDFAFHLPVYVLGDLLGIPQSKLHQTALWVNDFVRCLQPMCNPEQIERGKSAAGYLLDLFRSLLDAPSKGLLAMLMQEGKRVGRDDSDVIVANGIGFLSQAYEATAGLIGNTVLALVSHQKVCERIIDEPFLLHDIIQEVLRYDPPIQNTRRFVSQDAVVAGREMKAGDGVLVVLAAANRDAWVNSHPERFDIFRKERRIFTFGAGAHACPGETPAAIIAHAGVARLIASGIAFEHLTNTTTTTYRASANARIPLLFGNECEPLEV